MCKLTSWRQMQSVPSSGLRNFTSPERRLYCCYSCLQSCTELLQSNSLHFCLQIKSASNSVTALFVLLQTGCMQKKLLKLAVSSECSVGKRNTHRIAVKRMLQLDSTLQSKICTPTYM